MSLALCQLPGQQFLVQCEAVVESCTALPSAPETKKKQKAPVSAPSNAGPEEPVAGFSVVLSQTCLFPEGGGQPSDIGFIGDEPVLYTSRCPTTGVISHHTVNSIPASDQTVIVRADLARRLDHMQQHTSQHLISAICKRDFNAPTLSWNMSKYPEPSFIELDTPNLSQEQLDVLAATIDGMIESQTPVVTRVFESAEEAVKDADYSQALLLGRAKAFPEGLVGPARSVEIADLEFNTCCGTHAPTIGFLQMVAILRAEKYKGRVKLFFNAGKRVKTQYQEMAARTVNLTKVLSAPVADHVDAIEKLQVSLRNKMKDTEALVTRYSEQIFESIKASCLSQPDQEVTFFSYSHDDGVVDMKVLLAVAALFQTSVTDSTSGPKVVCLFSPTDAVCLPTKEEYTSAVQNAETLASVEGIFVVAGEKSLVSKWGEIVSKTTNGRGGGRPGLYQGRSKNLEKYHSVVELASAPSTVG